MSNVSSALPIRFGVFHLPEGSTLRDAAEKLSRIDPDKFRIPDAFAYVFHNPVESAPEEVVGITSYETKRPHYIVDRFGGNERIRRINGDQLIITEEVGLRDQIRESDLLDLMLSDGSTCVLEPSGNYHFVTPSLMHTDRFIRIGNLFKNRRGLDRLVFWLESSVQGVSGVLVDSWSISAVALRAMQRSELNVPFDCLPEHPAQNPEGCRSVIEDLVSLIGEKGKLLVIISISSSGHMIEKIASILKECGAGLEIEFLSLYGFTNTPETVTCMARIEHGGNTHKDQECGFCKEGSIAIPIDPSSYHLRAWRENLVMTGERYFNHAKEFINAYKEESGLFFVHRDDPADSRHHAFDVDVSRLLEIPKFLDKHRKVLRQFVGKVDLIVCPTHKVAQKLKEIAVEVLEMPFLVSDTLDRRDVDEYQRQAISDSHKILIVDDSLNSGSRIHRYIQSIREGGYGDFTSIDVHVGLARPETAGQLERVSKYISNRHPWQGKVHYTELLLLPRWGQDRCPWCKEFDRLSRLEEMHAKPPSWLTDRTHNLRNTSKGIAAEPFFRFPNVVTPDLGAGSVICDQGTTAMVVLFAIASGLQHHRSDSNEQRQLHPDFPLGNVLNPEMFIHYSEALIRAIFLRLVTRHELGSQAGVDSRELLMGQIQTVNQHILAGELVAALGRRAFPAISAEKFVLIFDGFLPKDDLLKLARALDLP